jgi:hypothetical protein
MTHIMHILAESTPMQWPEAIITVATILVVTWVVTR